jgi:uncharacterized protein YdhG (YjbR/CyaY superfamily)
MGRSTKHRVRDWISIGDSGVPTMGKSKALPTAIDQYISQFPHELQSVLQKIRQTIRRAAPDAEETISYQMPTFRLDSNLVHFAAHERHIGFYPTPSAIEHFKEDLTPYKHAKGSIQFPLNAPVPYDLIARIVAFRVQEVRAKTKTKVDAKLRARTRRSAD